MTTLYLQTCAVVLLLAVLTISVARSVKATTGKTHQERDVFCRNDKNENVVYSPSDLWGSYVPGLHIAMRAKRPNSLISSVGWSNLDGSKLLHLSTDGGGSGVSDEWVFHDGGGCGEQRIETKLGEEENGDKMEIKSTFVTELTKGGGDGGVLCRQEGEKQVEVNKHRDNC